MMRINGTTIAATLMASGLALGAQQVAAQDSKPMSDSYDKAADTSKTGSSKSDASKSGATGQSAGNESSTHPMIVLVPVVFGTDADLADGCWARLYDSEGFEGGMLTLVGPVDIPNTRPLPVTGFEFGTNYDSVAVGPNASLKIWDGSNYTNQAATLASGQKVPDLDTRMGPMEDIESLKVSCSRQG